MSRGSRDERHKNNDVSFVRLFGSSWVVTYQKIIKGRMHYGLTGALDSPFARLRLSDVPLSFIHEHANTDLDPEDTDGLLSTYLHS